MTLGEWYQAVPPGWEEARLCDHANVVNGFPFDSDLFSTSQGMPLVRIRDIYNVTTEVFYSGDPVSESIINKGDILIGMDGDFNVARWRGESALLNQRVCCIRPAATIDPRFISYVLPLPLRKTNILMFSTTVKHLSSFDVLKIRFLRPPLHEQRRIADYLDAETAEIDALVAEKERMLALLEEKRAALISRAVTRGLDPNAPLKPSGLDWLGDIPAHWTVERLKFHLCRLEQGWSPQCDNYPAGDDEWGVLKVGAVNSWEFNPIENKKLPDSESPIQQYEIRPRDVLMSRANTKELLGSVALVEDVRPKLLLCDKLYRLDVIDDRISRKFLVAFLRSKPGRYLFEQEATGASGSMQNIGQDTVRNVWIPVPPKSEQEAIASALARERRQTAEIEVALSASRSLLKERRSALITAAVTGQIEPEAMRA